MTLLILIQIWDLLYNEGHISNVKSIQSDWNNSTINKSSNMLKSNFSVCPIYGNIIHAMGENINSCCGITKEHYISFIAYVTNDRCEIVKLYPEQNAESRFLKRGKGIVYVYCNKDGLMKKKM